MAPRGSGELIGLTHRESGTIHPQGEGMILPEGVGSMLPEGEGTNLQKSSNDLDLDADWADTLMPAV